MSQNSVTVQRLVDEDSRWDDFVGRCRNATFFHRLGWKKVIEHSFNHRTCYLYAERGGDIVGVLPLVHMRSLLFGNFLSSLPFCVYGGVAADTDIAGSLLEDAAVEWAKRLNVDYLELRNRERIRSDWPTKELYVTFRKQLFAEPERNYKAIPRKQRAMIRKGIDAGLVACEEADTGTFYRLYAESVRNLGTPVFARKYFDVLREVFVDECEILAVYHEKRPISAVMSFYFRNEVLPYYAGAVTDARGFKAHDFMYWELMKRACERGCTGFDYGRSKTGTGSYRFKKHWGFSPEPLHYQYRLFKCNEIPNLSPTNAKFRFFVESWKRLPLSVACAIGPPIARYLG